MSISGTSVFPSAVSELIFEPLIEHIKRQGGKVQVRACCHLQGELPV